MRDNLSLGRLGERIACEYLASKGFQIIEKNFYKHWGEIDIIGIDKDTLVFVEVKTRMEYDTISPEQSMTPRKIGNLKKTALYYKNLHPELSSLLRIDFVGVEINGDMSVKRINLIKNISS